MRVGRFEKKHFEESQKARFMQGRYNVCGVVVDILPEKVSEVTKVIESLSGCEVLYIKPSGRVALTVEDTETFSSYDYLNQIQHMSDVLSVSLVSHHFE